MHDELCSQIIRSNEYDANGRQLVACKMLKGMIKNRSYPVNLNIITKDKWVDHYKPLWYVGDVNADHSRIQKPTTLLPTREN